MYISSVLGIIAIPGMMTGAILGGSSVLRAAEVLELAEESGELMARFAGRMEDFAAIFGTGVGVFDEGGVLVDIDEVDA